MTFALGNAGAWCLGSTYKACEISVFVRYLFLVSLTILTFEVDPDSDGVDINYSFSFLSQKRFSSEVIVPTHRHTPDRLLYLDHY